MVSSRNQAILTERPPSASEDSSSFCGELMPCEDVLRVNIRERDGEERVPKHLFLIAFLDANTACPVPLYHGALYKWRNYPAFHTTSSTSTPSPPSRHPSRSPKTPLSLVFVLVSTPFHCPKTPSTPSSTPCKLDCTLNLDGVDLWRAFSSSGLRLHVFPLDTGAHACAEVLENNRAVRAGIIVDAECPYSQQLLQRASSEKLFNDLLIWIIFEKTSTIFNNSGNNIIISSNKNDGSGYFGGSTLSPRGHELLRGLHVFPNSDVTWVQGVSGCHVEFLEVYQATVNTSLIVTGIGTTRTGEEHIILKLAGSSGRTRTRSDLRGGVLKAGAVVSYKGIFRAEGAYILYPDQFKDMYDLTMRHVDTWSKINYPLVEYLAASMNFSLIVVYSNSYGWQTNGSFDGLMGLLQRFEVDITASGIFMRLDRMEVSHFVAETFPDSHNIPAAIFIQCYKHFRSALQSFAVVLLCDTVFTGHYIAPKSFSLRITSFVFSLTTLFLYTAYSANIVALLQTPYSSIRGLRDLVESPLAVGIQDVEYNHVYLTESLDPVIMNLVKNKLSDKKVNQYCSPDKGIERVQHGMFAFQVDKALAYKLISDTFTERDKCGLMEVELFPLPLMSLATVRGSPYKEFIAQRVRWFREVGILDRIWKLWVSQRPVCEDKLKEFVSVGRMELYPAMQVFRIGAGVSVAVLMAELIHFHSFSFMDIKKLELFGFMAKLANNLRSEARSPQRTPREILKLRLSHPGDDSSEQTVGHRHDKKSFPGEGVVASQFDLVDIYLRGTSRWRTSLEKKCIRICAVEEWKAIKERKLCTPDLSPNILVIGTPVRCEIDS
uniref:Ionotropic glutamate receptor C-terminal domain-containing protein n=1 Tax=Timema monikensis TaxID=170555 RepID=A0A7R9DZ14_9NEOP|nr:unnamed protein product [Timema monikensis]